MLRLATYKKTKKKKKSEAKKRSKKKSEARRKRDRKSQKKEKARRVLLTKTKVTKSGYGLGPHRARGWAISGSPYPLFFFFLGSVK
jgi:hypothetical protein